MGLGFAVVRGSEEGQRVSVHWDEYGGNHMNVRNNGSRDWGGMAGLQFVGEIDGCAWKAGGVAMGAS